MKVLHLYPYLNLTCGITRLIYIISSSVESGIEHKVLSFGGDAVNKFKGKSIPFELIKNGNSSKKNIFANFIYIKNFCIRNKIDIIHSHHRYFDFLAYIISKFINIKTVTSVQSLVKGRKMFSYNADILIAPGNSVKEHLISYFGKPENKIKIINNFEDLSDFKTSEEPNILKSNLGIENSKFVIGFIGRFVFEEKGVDILLQAMVKLKNDHSDLFLLLVGKGKNGVEINKIVKENNIPAIIINPQEKIFDYFKILNVLVLPSRVDPFPLVMLESGIMEVPFIGSEVGGIKELIRNKYNGLLFEKNNANDLAEKILMFYNDEELRKNCSKQLRIDIESNYTSEILLKKLQEIYIGLNTEN
jgi:glycosyltransferase involved in cell wall biosynthesis